MTPFIRQNDRTSIIMLKAAYYCECKDKQTRYAMIFLSVALTMVGILNKYFSKIFPSLPSDSTLHAELTTALMLSGGLLVVFQIFISRYTNRMQIERANILERCDCYVFGIMQNKSVLRPISETVVEDYASRVRKADEKFRNYYYLREETPPKTGDNNSLILKYQRTQFEDEYRLLLFVHPFYLTVWIMYGLLVFAMAVTADDTFMQTLANILIPSLSAIVMIFNSAHSHELQMNYDRNSLAVIDEHQKNAAITNEMVRGVQDGLFVNRKSVFLVPSVLAKRHRKKLESETWGYDVSVHKPIKDYHIRRLPSGETQSYDVRTTPIPTPPPQKTDFEQSPFADKDKKRRYNRRTIKK